QHQRDRIQSADTEAKRQTADDRGRECVCGYEIERLRGSVFVCQCVCVCVYVCVCVCVCVCVFACVYLRWSALFTIYRNHNSYSSKNFLTISCLFVYLFIYLFIYSPVFCP